MSTQFQVQLPQDYDPAEDIAELKAIQRRALQLRWARYPELWAKERLGDFLWSAQVRILRALRDYRRVAVKSCHGIGKTRTASVAVGWWIDTRVIQRAYVMTTAPTGIQVRAVLWREINRVHTRGIDPITGEMSGLGGSMNQTEWRMIVPGGKTELVAQGRKPDEYDQAAFQGIHADEVLLVLDEACGVPKQIWEGGDSLIANDASKALAIGNPDEPNTEFERICKPGSGWHVIEVSAFDTPEFTGEPVPDTLKKKLIGRTYVEEKRRQWAPMWRWVDEDGRRTTAELGVRVVPPKGETLEDGFKKADPFWSSKIFGRFPPQGSEMGLIPEAWIEAAQERDLSAKAPMGPRRIGVDVGAGGDSSTCCYAEGPVVRILWEDHEPDTMQTLGRVVTTAKEVDAEMIKIDTIGIGLGMVNRGQELNGTGEMKIPVFGINVGEAAYDSEHFTNKKAEDYWNLRTRFEQGEIDLDIDDKDTARELVSIRFKRLSSGKIQIESKDQAKARGIPSPNRAEAVMLAFARVEEPVSVATWGRR